MTLDKQQEERVRGAFAVLVDSTPLGADFEELADTQTAKNKTRINGALVFGTAFVVVLLGGLLAWIAFGSSPNEPSPSEVAGTVLPEALDTEGAQSLLDYIPDRQVIRLMRPFSDALPPTFEEYQEVALWTASCIESVGAELVFGTDAEVEAVAEFTPGIPGSKLYVWLAGPVAPGSPAGSGDHASEFCKMMSGYDNVKMYYVNNPSQEDLDAWYDSVRTCLTEEGIDFDEVFYPKTTRENGRSYYEITPTGDVPIHCWP